MLGSDCVEQAPIVVLMWVLYMSDEGGRAIPLTHAPSPSYTSTTTAVSQPRIRRELEIWSGELKQRRRWNWPGRVSKLVDVQNHSGGTL